MSLSLSGCARKLVCGLCGLILALFAPPAYADPKPLTKEEQAKVDKAIDRGVAFVKKSQKETGEFGEAGRDQVGMYSNHGYIFFPALALLESGVSSEDPVLQKAIKIVRGLEPRLDRTYEVSLAILFLDRLGDPKDEERIRSLALRLIAAQTYTGGWGYACPTLNKQNQNDLWKTLDALQAKDNPPFPPHDDKAPKPHNPVKTRVIVPMQLRWLAIFQNPKNLFKRKEKGISWVNPPSDLNTLYLITSTDNSNTQFAILALWAAGRHGVPLGRTLDLIVRRFAASQNKDGSWCYYYRFGGAIPRAECNIVVGHNCNIAAGLIGLAMQHGTRLPDQNKREPAIHEQIVEGLAALSTEVGTPVGRMDRPIRMEDLYFLWSVERVAVLYNLPVIGEKDWYRWGAEILVTNQNEDGSWDRKGVPRRRDASIQASFALLFLRRANWIKDLTAKLPFTARELNQSIANRLRSLEKPTSPSDSRGSANPKSRQGPQPPGSR